MRLYRAASVLRCRDSALSPMLAPSTTPSIGDLPDAVARRTRVRHRMTENLLGIQIPNFTYPGTDSAQLYDLIVAQSREAEDAGFDRLTVMDHFYQLPGIGAHREPMLECYTLLSALAQHTSSMRLAALVTGNTYRNPALLAKTVSALDVVSGGRATLGIGAGWFELEHQAMGFDFGTFTDRFERLEEALQIIVGLLRGETVTFDGDRYRVQDFVNSPQPVSRIPIMIGGNGERKTLRMVAQYADESNLVSLRGPEEVPRKLEALEEHCQRLGRDRSEVTVSVLVATSLAPTMEQSDADLRAMIAHKGLPEAAYEMARSYMVHGDPDTVGEELQAFMATGIDGLIVSLMPSGHIPGRISLLGQVASSAINSRRSV